MDLELKGCFGWGRKREGLKKFDFWAKEVGMLGKYKLFLMISAAFLC